MITRGRPVHENGRFCGQSDEIDGIGQKIGPFLGREGLNDSSGQKRGVFVDKIEANKKETPPKGCLMYLALSREGRLKNRGRPWPRERSRVSLEKVQWTFVHEQ